MRQLTFKAVYGEFTERTVFLEEGIEEELVRQLAEVIAKVVKGERREADERQSGQ